MNKEDIQRDTIKAFISKVLSLGDDAITKLDSLYEANEKAKSLYAQFTMPQNFYNDIILFIQKFEPLYTVLEEYKNIFIIEEDTLRYIFADAGKKLQIKLENIKNTKKYNNCYKEIECVVTSLIAMFKCETDKMPFDIPVQIEPSNKYAPYSFRIAPTENEANGHINIIMFNPKDPSLLIDIYFYEKYQYMICKTNDTRTITFDSYNLNSIHLMMHNADELVKILNLYIKYYESKLQQFATYTKLIKETILPYI